MTDDILSPAVPSPNYLHNTWMRDVLGNKLDIASIAQTASAMALLRSIQESLAAYVLSPYEKVVEFPDFASEDSKVVLAIGLYDKATFQEIPIVDITAGTVDILRIRAGVETSITAGAALTKKDGLLYVEIDTDNVNWANGDAVKVEPATVSSVVISAVSYNVTFAPQICKLSDYGLLGDNIASILTTITDMAKGMIEADGINFHYPVIDETQIFQVSLMDELKDFPTFAEITSPGACTIIRIRPGVGSATIVASQPCGAGNNGGVGYSYNWPNASWQKGDVAEITFSGIQVTQGGKVFKLPDYESFAIIGLAEMLSAWDGVVQDITDIETLCNQISTDVVNLHTKIDIIDTNVDDIETLLGTVDGKIDIIDAHVDLLVEKPQPFEIWGNTFIPGGLTGIVIDTTPTTLPLGDVVLPNWPVGTIKRVEAILGVRKLEENSGLLNYLVNDTMLQVYGGSSPAWIDAYDFVPGEFSIDGNEHEGQGRKITSEVDIKSQVDIMNTTYNFRIELAESIGDDLILHDVRVGLRIWV